MVRKLADPRGDETSGDEYQMKFTTALLPEPARLKWLGQRHVSLSAVVLKNGRPWALFETETSARAYASHLNKIEKELLCPS